MGNATLARNETHVQVTRDHLKDRSGAEAVHLAIREATGDQGATVDFLLRGFSVDHPDHGDIVIAIQAHTRWWAYLPQELANVIDHDLFGFTAADRAVVLGFVDAGLCCGTLAWHEGEPDGWDEDD